MNGHNYADNEVTIAESKTRNNTELKYGMKINAKKK